jgi:predicted nucleotidyltransferase
VGDPLALLGISGSRASLLRYLALHPEERIYLRQLERLFGERSASLQRDLKALVAIGAIRPAPRLGGRRVEYEVSPDWPAWGALRRLLVSLSDPPTLAREALRGVAGVDAAFVYGSFAAGRATAESDVDVFVMGEAIDRPRLYRALTELAVLTGREVNPSCYTPTVLRDRLTAPGSPSRRYLREVLSGPKHWLAGPGDALEAVAEAAGVPLAR